MANGTSGDLLKGILSLSGNSKVIVHGGGPTVTSVCERMGIKPVFVKSPDGLRSRYTDSETIEAYIMAMRGKINSDIVLGLQRLGRNAVGISGIDGPTFIAERKKKLITINEKGRKMFIEGGFTGKIVRSDPEIVTSIMESGRIPVLSPIALSTEFEALNVDGDRAASAIAGAIQADELILLTNVDGVLNEGKTVDRILLRDLPSYIENVGNGMDKKLIAAGEALKGGCRKVIIANGRYAGTVEGLSHSGRGTVITA